MVMHRRATISHNRVTEELVRRYGKDAPIAIWLEDDHAVVLIDGEQRDEIVGGVVT